MLVMICSEPQTSPSNRYLPLFFSGFACGSICGTGGNEWDLRSALAEPMSSNLPLSSFSQTFLLSVYTLSDSRGELLPDGLPEYIEGILGTGGRGERDKGDVGLGIEEKEERDECEEMV